jgi:predicted acylesterase/phospholipase RssA
MKVAFQAGALQVLLDEADLGFDDFDLADGCSGGVFNLAMWCQGCSGKEIADNWRDFPVVDGMEPNWRKYWKLFRADSLLAMGRFRRNILRKHWDLSWIRIRGMAGRQGRLATFNAYNFSKQELVVREANQMNENFLVACVALPRWFPPVKIKGDTYIDAVFITDANLEEAIKRGATELWVIWTVSRRNEWTSGFIGNYFGVIETAANGHFARICERIDRSNELIASGNPDEAEFAQHIDVKVIKGEVPLHYLMNVNSDRFTQAVELGVSAARQWCLQHQIPVTPIPPAPGTVTSLNFWERMEGFMSPGVVDYEQGRTDGERDGRKVVLRMKVDVQDVDAFISDPDHRALVTGTLELGALGGTVEVHDGRFNLMPFKDDFDERWMFYWLPFTANDGRQLVVSGYKLMVDDRGRDLWKDNTTLFTHILDGAGNMPPVATMIDTFRAGQPEGNVVAAGIVSIHLDDFTKQLMSMRADGPTKRAEFGAKVRFSAFFVGGLWDIYARRLLPASPF